MPAHRDIFYGGSWHAPHSGKYVPTLNPANGKVLAEIAEADACDADLAIQSASQAFEPWPRLKPQERAAKLREAAWVMREHAEEFAMLNALNTGGPVANIANDARGAAESLQYFSGLVTEIKGETIPVGDGSLNYTVREPLGVVARILAYNHPCLLAGAKIGAPLATGNTVVIKPSEQAPLSALRMAELIGQIFPPASSIYCREEVNAGRCCQLTKR
jgi:betaine-aldehyde dehydrogenase